MAQKHEYEWVDQEERYHFGDRSKPYPVDIWKCQHCGKEIATRGGRNPAPGNCQT